MPVRFDTLKPIYPPRASHAINPDALLNFKNFWAQYKYNDTRTLIYVMPDGKIELFNRHKEHHVMYKMSEAMHRSLKSLSLSPGKMHVLDGGLMHNKTRNVKDRIVLWDILVSDSEYLIGSTYRSRYEKLLVLMQEPKELEQETKHQIALRVNQNIWLAQIFKEELGKRYQELIHLDEIEGLILKDPNGRLQWGIKEENNGAWQIRVRKPNPNYRF
jgi:ATP-dependent DNA ligase